MASSLNNFFEEVDTTNYSSHFLIEQLDAVVKEVHRNTKQLPLVVLHRKRVLSLLEDASKRELIDEWMDQGVLYETPFGSNDDW